MGSRRAAERAIEWDFASGCLEASAVHLFHRAGRCADEVFARKVGPQGITRSQFAVLATVGRCKLTDLQDLVRKTGMSRAALAAAVQRMIAVGLVCRRGKKGAGPWRFALTGAGRRALDAVEPVAIQADNQIWAALPRSRRWRFFSDLVVVVRLLEQR
jgi:DNA-binding MarR family transcriptional regulator